MTDTPAFLSNRLRVEGEKTIAFFKALPKNQWKLSVYTEGTVWKVRDVLAHFVTTERGFLQLFEDIVAGGSGVQEDFDIDRYNAGQQKKTQVFTAEELLAQFVAVREEMASMISLMSESDLQKQGRHPFLGITSLGEMAKMVYRHNQIHYRDIRKLLGE
jgi:hypothetical protein